MEALCQRKKRTYRSGRALSLFTAGGGVCVSRFPYGRMCGAPCDSRYGTCRSFLRLFSGKGRIPSDSFGAWEGRGCQTEGCGSILGGRHSESRVQCTVWRRRGRHFFGRQAEYAGKGYPWKKQGGSASVRQVWRAGGNFI